jgi:hypothetical protein
MMVVMVVMAVRLMVMMMVMGGAMLPIVGKLHIALGHILLGALGRTLLFTQARGIVGLHQRNRVVHRREQIGVGGDPQRL